MSIIGKLRNLEVLKLKRYAFRGPKWTINCLTDFEKLKFLLIEDTDLVQWELKSPVFRQLERLSFKLYYKLQKLPTYLPISPFRKMEIFDCNPLTLSRAEQMRYELVPPPPPLFPSSLKRLSLSGFGYDWEEMSIIGKLQNLEVLKLKSYAFRGPKWTINCLTDFEKLKFLLVEDTDLVQWEIKLPVFRQLERLSFKHCYKLQKLPTYLPISSFRKMEIFDCNPLTYSWAEKMRKALVPFPVEAHRSWIGKNKP